HRPRRWVFFPLRTDSLTSSNKGTTRNNEVHAIASFNRSICWPLGCACPRCGRAAEHSSHFYRRPCSPFDELLWEQDQSDSQPRPHSARRDALRQMLRHEFTLRAVQSGDPDWKIQPFERLLSQREPIRWLSTNLS